MATGPLFLTPPLFTAALPTSIVLLMPAAAAAAACHSSNLGNPLAKAQSFHDVRNEFLFSRCMIHSFNFPRVNLFKELAYFKCRESV
jgi:hypothetical protein